jgi:hypothetical protein
MRPEHEVQKAPEAECKRKVYEQMIRKEAFFLAPDYECEKEAGKRRHDVGIVNERREYVIGYEKERRRTPSALECIVRD